MRTLLASALFALACGCSDPLSRPPGAGAIPNVPGGPDPVVLRVPREGGALSASLYPQLDSAIWRASSRTPALRRIVTFGAEDGYLAGIDSRGAAVRMDLRIGSVSTGPDTALRFVSSADGAAIYALTASGTITRFTPSGDSWTLTPRLPAAALFAQPDGALIIAGAVGKRVIVWRVRPPETILVDSLSFDVGGDAQRNATMIAATARNLSDRIVFGAHESVIAVRSRDMHRALELDLGDPITAIEATPSGDRLFVALGDSKRIRIVDRFEEAVSGKISVPAVPRALRMDPLGRAVLVHGGGDTVFVVSLAKDQVIARVRSEWREDLPLVQGDGTLMLARGPALVLTTTALTDGRILPAGGEQFWHSVRWNGFRPRAAGLDAPVSFRTSAPRDSMDRVDSGRVAHPDSVVVYRVTFAAVQDEKQARALAARIAVNGQSPAVITTDRRGTTIFRVELGPYPTRDEATRVGQASGQSYWITEGPP